MESEECGALEVTPESDRQSTEPQRMLYERFEASFRAPQRSRVLVSTFSNTRHTKTSTKRIYTLEFLLKRSLKSRFLLYQTLEISRFDQNTSVCTRNSAVRIFDTWETTTNRQEAFAVLLVTFWQNIGWYRSVDCLSLSEVTSRAPHSSLSTEKTTFLFELKKQTCSSSELYLCLKKTACDSIK